MNHIYSLQIGTGVKLVQVNARCRKDADERIQQWVNTHHKGLAYIYVGELFYKIVAHQS